MDFLDEANRSILKEQMSKRRKGKIEPYEITWTRKDGRKTPTIMSPKAFFDSEGQFKGSFAVITDITDRKLAEQALREREATLKIRTHELEEVNSALRVLLKEREEDKGKLEEKVLLNIKEVIVPYVEKLKKSRLDAKHMAYLSILESNLNDIVSPFAHKLSSKYLSLTPAEIRTAHLVKDGRTTKEIAGLLNVSTKTVEFHRDNIRKKIGIKNKKANLRTHLLSIQ